MCYKLHLIIKFALLKMSLTVFFFLKKKILTSIKFSISIDRYFGMPNCH